MGGDDFIAKPFDLEVLSAKVQAVLRRCYSFQRQLALLEYKDVVVSLADMSLSHRGKSLKLSKNEFRILQILFENGGDVVSRESIMKRLWEDECFVDDNTLTVNRKGVGYQLNE